MDLNEFFKEHNKVALAFSGGVDSSYLLYAAIKSGAQVRAYYVNAAFQPQFELDDAMRLAKQLNADMKVLTADVLSNETVAKNPSDRCYHCKNVIFNMILAEAKKDGFTVLMDGTNASDAEDDRPGMRALRELCVYSPLRICGLTKTEIRRRSKEAGLFTWNKPAYACLATRIPTNERITAEKLEKTEEAENYLFSLGFTDFRVRYLNDSAKIQMPAAQMTKLLEMREKILIELKKYYKEVLLDLQAR